MTWAILRNYLLPNTESIYTSVPYHIAEILAAFFLLHFSYILCNVGDSLAGASVPADCIFSAGDVEDAVSRLKSHSLRERERRGVVQNYDLITYN
jgi:hypothetical protein